MRAHAVRSVWRWPRRGQRWRGRRDRVSPRRGILQAGPIVRAVVEQGALGGRARPGWGTPPDPSRPGARHRPAVELTRTTRGKLPCRSGGRSGAKKKGAFLRARDTRRIAVTTLRKQPSTYGGNAPMRTVMSRPEAGQAVYIGLDVSRTKWVFNVRWGGAEQLLGWRAARHESFPARLYHGHRQVSNEAAGSAPFTRRVSTPPAQAHHRNPSTLGEGRSIDTLPPRCGTGPDLPQARHRCSREFRA